MNFGGWSDWDGSMYWYGANAVIVEQSDDPNVIDQPVPLEKAANWPDHFGPDPMEPDYYWVYVPIPAILFDLHANRVYFDNLSETQLASVVAGANLYSALGGADTITLPQSVHLAPGVVFDRTKLFEAGDGGDTVVGSAYRDLIDGGADNDTIHGNDGADWIWGGSGTDIIHGGGADDLIGADDRLIGGEGADFLYGDGGDDFLFGDGAGDELHGGAGNDRLYGGDGSDFLYGDAGSDHLYAGSGVYDYVDGGNDNKTGGRDYAVDTVYFDKAGSEYMLTVTPGIMFSASDGVNNV